MITINVNTFDGIDENIFLQNATKITENFLNSEFLEYSPIKNYNFLQNHVEFDVTFCDNAQVHQINKDFRGKDTPTDVITFALFADSEPEMRLIHVNTIYLGEIIISLEKIKTQAKENHKTFEEELYFIFAHGILHLFGFTHQTDEKLEFMIALQQRLAQNVQI